MNFSYEYLLKYTLSYPNSKSLTVLDYGCGNGELVKLLRNEGINCLGVDTFYEGASYPIKDDPLFKDGTIKLIKEGGSLPFAPGSFDLVIANQVFEHIENLPPVIDQLDTVLKPNGIIYAHFPTLDAIREGHLGIPLSHWFQPYSKARYYYMLLWRIFGFGLFKQNKSIEQWAKDASTWINKFCFYKPYRYYSKLFKERHAISRKEIKYIAYRLKNAPKLVKWLTSLKFFEPLYRLIFTRFGFVAVELTKNYDDGRNDRPIR